MSRRRWRPFCRMRAATRCVNLLGVRPSYGARAPSSPWEHRQATRTRNQLKIPGSGDAATTWQPGNAEYGNACSLIKTGPSAEGGNFLLFRVASCATELFQMVCWPKREKRLRWSRQVV